jgi:tetratricopeptide (TPR) repeat protein
MDFRRFFGKMNTKIITGLAAILFYAFLLNVHIPVLFAQEDSGSGSLEILNPEYSRPPNTDDNVEISDQSSFDDVMKKINYYYATRDFDKGIELCQWGLNRTKDPYLTGALNFSLSSFYLEKGIEAYQKNNDDSLYKMSIECSKKSLEVMPENWQALANIGGVYFNMKDWKQAAYYFSEAEKYLDKNDPNYAAVELQRGLSEEMSGRN